MENTNPETGSEPNNTFSRQQAVDYLLKANEPKTDNSDAEQESNNLDQSGQEQQVEETTAPETDVELDSDTEVESDEVDYTESENVEDTQEEVSTEPEMYTVRVNGENVDVTLEELQNGYSRTADYTKKSQTLAEQRKQFEQQAQQIQAERQALAENLKAVEQFLSNPVPEPDANLINSDPSEYLRQKDAFEKHQATVKAVRDEQQRIATQQQQDLVQQYTKNLEVEKTRLMERIPEWTNSDVATKEKQSITNYARKLGFTDNELSQASDSRAIEILRKAWLYDNLMAKNQVAKKKVTKAPKMAKGNVPTTKSETKARRNKQLFDRLKKSGKREDAVNYLLAQKQQ